MKIRVLVEVDSEDLNHLLIGLLDLPGEMVGMAKAAPTAVASSPTPSGVKLKPTPSGKKAGRKPGRKPRYAAQAMQDAVQGVLGGMTQTAAAAKFGVPIGTLQYHLKKSRDAQRNAQVGAQQQQGRKP